MISARKQAARGQALAPRALTARRAWLTARRVWHTARRAWLTARRPWLTARRGLCSPTGFLSLVFFGVLLVESRNARAADCEPPQGVSACFDAENLWWPTGRSRFASLSSPPTLAARELSVALAGSYLREPAVLAVPSPDPEGRRVPLVRDAVTGSLLLALGVTHRLELGLALPYGFQRGLSVAALSTRKSSTYSEGVFRDPRVSAAYALYQGEPIEGFEVRAGSRLTLLLPLGNQARFAGAPGPTLAPTFDFEAQRGRFYAGLSLGARLRDAVSVADVRFGSQAVVALGVGVELLDEQRLLLGLETRLYPSLVSQHVEPGIGRPPEQTLLLPAESLISVGSRFDRFDVQLGVGTSLPISKRERLETDASRVTAHFAGLTAPKLRALVQFRYTFEAHDESTQPLSERGSLSAVH